MSKHTPGPWSVHSQNPTTVGVESKTLRHRFIASTNQSTLFKSSARPVSEQKANAHLIAAAPEMLEFIEAIKSEQEGFGDHGDAQIISMCKVLIRKARGENHE